MLEGEIRCQRWEDLVVWRWEDVVNENARWPLYRLEFQSSRQTQGNVFTLYANQENIFVRFIYMMK